MVSGSSVQAGNNIDLTGANVTIASVEDTYHFFQENKQGNSVTGKKTTTKGIDSVTQVGSEVMAGGKLSINTTDDVTLLASSLGGDKGGIEVNAGKNINILAAEDFYATLDKVEKSSLGGLIASKDTTYDSVTTQSKSVVFSGENLKMTSGGDTTIYASDVSAVGSGAIETGGNLNVLAGKDSTYHYEEHYKRSLDNLEALGNIAKELVKIANPLSIWPAYIAKEGLETGKIELFNSNLGSVSESSYKKYSETTVQSNLTFGSGLDIKADKDVNLVSSNIIADNLSISADNVSITEQVLENYSENKSHGKTTDEKTTTNVGSSLGALGNLSINATDDILVRGSNIGAGDNINLTGANVTISSVEDTYHFLHESKSGNSITGKRKRTKAIDSVTQVGSDVQAGGKLSISTTDDVTLLASSLGGDKGGIEVNAGKNINILAAEDFYATLDKVQKSSLGGLVSSKDMTYDSVTTQSKSVVFSGENLKMTSGSDTTVFASELAAQGDMGLNAGGNINILAGTDTQVHNEMHEKKSFSGLDFGADRGRVSAGVSYSYSSNEIESSQESTAASTLTAGGKINMKAGSDILVKGSDISADSAQLEADRILLLAQEELSKYNQQTKDGKITASIGIGNTFVDAGYAVSDFIKATKAVAEAKRELEHMQDLKSKGKASQAAVNDAIANLGILTLSLATATAAMAQAVANAAVTTNTLTAGVYADVGISTNYTETTTNNSTVFNRGTNISTNKDITFDTTGDMQQQGTSVTSSAGDINYNILGNLNISSVENSSSSKTEVKQVDASYRAGTEGVNFGTSLGKSSSTELNTMNVNSTTTAEHGAINYNVGSNMSAAGYNALAEDINVDVWGKLTLESLQDTAYAKSNNLSAGIGRSTYEKGGSGLSGNFSTGKGYTDSAWVNDQTSLIGTNSVNVAADSIHLKGGMIGNVENGEDKGNLSVNTNSLTYENITDFYISSETGFGIGLSTADINTLNGGETTLSLQHEGQEREQITKATIGSGNINIGGTSAGNISDLNRAVNSTQEIIKDKTTGVLDSTLAIDNRFYTPSGREEILSQTKNIMSNMGDSITGINPINVYERSQAAVDRDEVFKNMTAKARTLSIWDVNTDERTYMGLDSTEEDRGKPVYKRLLSPKDNNPVFAFLYHFIPGGKSATLVHDVQMKKTDVKMPLYKTISIPGSFAMTYYSLIGQPFSKKERN